MKIEYSIEGGRWKSSIEFRSVKKLVYYRGDKYYPTHTQCILEVNGLIKGVGTVIKHEKDNDNPKYARVAAAKKVMNLLYFKEERTFYWNEILKL